ncbi:hypothetical protein HNR77_005857 [Paenibacillus sp. JGP012]|nr:hypothetical protein [Paenibacillus sp. JGP012]
MEIDFMNTSTLSETIAKKEKSQRSELWKINGE